MRRRRGRYRRNGRTAAAGADTAAGANERCHHWQTVRARAVSETASSVEMPIPPGLVEEIATPPLVPLQAAPALSGEPSATEGAAVRTKPSDAASAATEPSPATQPGGPSAAELAFTARLTVSSSQPAAERAPELHLAVLPELRTRPEAQEVKTPAAAGPTPVGADASVPQVQEGPAASGIPAAVEVPPAPPIARVETADEPGPAAAARPTLSSVAASPARGALPVTSAVPDTPGSGPGQGGPAHGEDPASGLAAKPAVSQPAATAGKPRSTGDGGPQPDTEGP